MTDLITRDNNAVAEYNGLGIEGLEEVPVSVLPIPFLRLVQPSSKNVDLSNGREAAMGSFFYNDTKQDIERLRFVMLKSKIGKVSYEVDGEIREGTKLNILGFDLDNNKIFILSLSVMSISNFGKLVAQLKQKEATKAWEYEVIATSVKSENKKGKFYVADFELSKKVDTKTIADMEMKANTFGVALNRDLSDTEQSVEVPAPEIDDTPTEAETFFNDEENAKKDFDQSTEEQVDSEGLPF